jgi:serine protease Do
VFGLARHQPPVGTAVGTIGYPLGGPKSFTTGAVSGLGRDLDIGDTRMSDLIQTDAGINPGNSGGPLLDLDGDVVGLVDAKATDAENIGYAIPASLARTRLAGWRADPSPVRASGDCSAPTGPDAVTLTVTDHSQDPAAQGIADTLATYANAINDGDYRTAYHLLTPRDQRAVSYDTFSRGTASTLIVSMDLDSVDTGTATRHVEVRFTSVQDPALGHDGQSCSDWRMTYILQRQEGGWRIDRARPHEGSPTAC